jgi:hypothetical protein
VSAQRAPRNDHLMAVSHVLLLLDAYKVHGAIEIRLPMLPPDAFDALVTLHAGAIVEHKTYAADNKPYRVARIRIADGWIVAQEHVDAEKAA